VPAWQDKTRHVATLTALGRATAGSPKDGMAEHARREDLLDVDEANLVSAIAAAEGSGAGRFP